MAAATTVFETLGAGAHVIAPASMYWTIRLWLQNLAARGRIEVDFVANRDLDTLGATLRRGKTKLVWVETPSNPLGAGHRAGWSRFRPTPDCADVFGAGSGKSRYF